MINKKTSVALGLFDGVHLGHRAVLDLALKNAVNCRVPSVFTFMPDTVLKKQTGSDGYIYPQAVKEHILKELGFGMIYSPSFSEICEMTGEEFAENILVKKMNAEAVCCGTDFRFGKNASCGVSELKKLGERYGFEVFTAEDVTLDGNIVSSGLIRRLLSEGDVKSAEKYLSAPYSICSNVVNGAHLGRTIGFPTANQLFEDGQLVVRFGVYASRVTVDGKTFPAMTNIGVKPTVEYDGKPLAETHIIGFEGDIYGKKIKTSLVEFIRPEMKFSSVEELKKQIENDLKCCMLMDFIIKCSLH